MNYYEVKEKIVKQGESNVFNNWHEYQGITEEEFLDGLKWLCEDPRNGGSQHNQLTRDLGCCHGKLYRLHRTFGPDGFVTSRREDGTPWVKMSYISDEKGRDAYLGTAIISVADRI